MAVLPPRVGAETLPEAIAIAYQSNPTLQSARAQLRATDETYVQARSGYGPTIQLQGVASYNDDRLRRSFSGDTALPSNRSRANLGQAEVVVEQPVYSGGRTTLEVRSAEDRIRAGREPLRASEQNIMLRSFRPMRTFGATVRASRPGAPTSPPSSTS